MGTDAVVRVKLQDLDGELPYIINCQNWVKSIETPKVFEAALGCRFWSPDYPRGSWPQILSVLVQLLATPNVETVWYGGDDKGNFKVVSEQLLAEFTSEYIKTTKSET